MPFRAPSRARFDATAFGPVNDGGMRMLRYLAIGTALGVLVGCAHHPARVRCEDHLQPINARAPAGASSPTTSHGARSGEAP
jgi:hypothetical protein